MMTETEALRELAQRQKARLDGQEATIAAQQQALDGAAEWGGDVMSECAHLRRQLAEAEAAKLKAEQQLIIALALIMRLDVVRAARRMAA
jgi:hypothetical protein